jgi:acetyltransferase
VRSDLKGSGLGELLMHKLIAYQRSRGTRRLVATVLAENERMLQLAGELGFVAEAPNAGVRNISLALS